MVLRTVASRQHRGNYPSIQFSFSNPDANHRLTFQVARRLARGSATFETGFSCTPLDPLLVMPVVCSCAGFNSITSLLCYEWNLTVQYQLTSSCRFRQVMLRPCAPSGGLSNNNTVTSLADVNVDRRPWSRSRISGETESTHTKETAFTMASKPSLRTI